MAAKLSTKQLNKIYLDLLDKLDLLGSKKYSPEFTLDKFKITLKQAVQKGFSVNHIPQIDNTDLFLPLLFEMARISQDRLHDAYLTDYRKILKMLIEAGADVNLVLQGSNVRPLHYAVLCNPVAVEVLIHAGADVNAQTTSGVTPIIAACSAYINAYDSQREATLREIIYILLNNNVDLSRLKTYLEITYLAITIDSSKQERFYKVCKIIDMYFLQKTQNEEIQEFNINTYIYEL